MNFFDNDLTTIHNQLVNHELTSYELTKQTIDALKVTDQTIDAFLTLDEDNALVTAKAIDEKGIDPANLLAGIPIAIKDNIMTKDLRTTAASKILENFTPIYDATVMEKVHANDMVVIGKTNMDEFAMGGSTENSAFKITKNPWDTTKVPGGSSGGSAAAVSAGMVPFALGSDTGGSIRQPASFTGVVGMKPTYGRISRWGLIAFGSSLDQIGPFSRGVKDNAALLAALVGEDKRDGTSVGGHDADFTAKLDAGVKGLRIGLPKEYLGEGVQQAVKDAILAAADKYRELGATVDEVSLPHSKYGVAAYYIISSSEASSNLQRFDGIRYGVRAQDAKNLNDVYIDSRTQGFGPEVKRRIMLGMYSLSAGYYDAYFKKAAQVRTLMRQDFANIFADHDLILGPVAPTPAYGIGADVSDPLTMYAGDVLSVPVNMAGLPGLSLPAGFADGLPIGMQLIGPAFAEATLYQAGYAFEQATDFHKQVPTLGGND
ncbi:Asp-tRNA(Asn)/Glu-tRNA(Gln) amidotransferase subunit GatA [Loigolactobacillus zhaoyuanensis]|uniref:Glutamyl-tRNA(Gln) amidotransferase subunit A n=1 Tax=Loigolactobacillus zhaoyuanensis TaxID=2486017 RepID=A0ABW8UHF9_9LACO|nr:Asp-tRNA(Asn)/Glu-tRNA(Gln) amidotransferase subunit GatA [Loigolactobacillus zhaoyuanensis]